MKYLKKFNESYGDIAEDIAKDILPILKDIKDKKGFFTVSMFDNLMEERKGDLELTDEVMNHLVNMGFDFDDEDDSDDSEIYSYTLN